MHLLKSAASALTSGFRTFLPTCRQVSRLQSDALDRPLTLPGRIGLRLHLLVCRWCRRYGQQIRFLRRAAHQHSDELTGAAPRALSSEARERLRRLLSERAK